MSFSPVMFLPFSNTHPKMIKPASAKTMTIGAMILEVSNCDSTLVSVGVVVFVGEKCSVVVGTSGVCVDVGVAEGGAGVGVTEAGGVTRKSNFCPGWMIADDVSPFHPNNSDRLTS